MHPEPPRNRSAKLIAILPRLKFYPGYGPAVLYSGSNQGTVEIFPCLGVVHISAHSLNEAEDLVGL